MRRYLKAKSSEKLPPSPQWTLEVNIYIHRYKLLEVFLVKLVIINIILLVKLVIIFCMMTTREHFFLIYYCGIYFVNKRRSPLKGFQRGLNRGVAIVFIVVPIAKFNNIYYYLDLMIIHFSRG